MMENTLTNVVVEEYIGDEDSDMDISDDDGDHEVINGVCSSLYNEYDYYIQNTSGRCTSPILSANDPDKLDTSHACFFHVNGPTLKKKSPSLLNAVLGFSFQCLRESNLELFSHPGDPEWCDGGLVSVEGMYARDHQPFIDLAEKAVYRYNLLTKEKKLQFKEVMKTNFYCTEYFLTFSATTMDTGESGLYQAALKWIFDSYLVGLLRECYTGKVLLIMTVTGAEEELAAKRKVLEAYGLNVGG